MRFGLKFTGGGTHISRTIMLAELKEVLAAVPAGSPASDYRDAILQRNVLGKTTDSTRQKSLHHLRELYALDDEVPIFKLLRALHAMDAASLPLLAMQIAWSRDHLLRSTTPAIFDVPEGDRVETKSFGAGGAWGLSRPVFGVEHQQNRPQHRVFLDAIRAPRRARE